jgi:hypothetical protein
VRRSIAAALVAIAAAAALGAGDEAALARGAAIVEPFRRELLQALKEGLARGPVEAISACRIQAPRIAQSLSRDGVIVGRTSHRLRNPDNAPRAWVRPLLDAYLADPAQRGARAVTLGDGRWGYVEPIGVQPLCLTCHGESLSPAVADSIAALYPGDRAIGFRAGDFRGLFWAEFPGSR